RGGARRGRLRRTTDADCGFHPLEADRGRGRAGRRALPCFHHAARAGRRARSLRGDARRVLRTVDRRRGGLPGNRGVACRRRVHHTPPGEPGRRRQDGAGAGMGSGWAQECLPFYELVDPASFRPDGSKPTRLRWDNYRTEETALVPPAPLPVPAVSAAPGSPPALRRASSSLQPWVFLPDQFHGADEGSGRWASAARIARLARGAAYAAVAVLAVAVLVRLYS